MSLLFVQLGQIDIFSRKRDGRSRNEHRMKKESGDSLNRFLSSFKTSLSSPLLVQRIYSADYFAFLGPPLIVLPDKKEGEEGRNKGENGRGREKERKKEGTIQTTMYNDVVCNFGLSL